MIYKSLILMAVLFSSQALAQTGGVITDSAGQTPVTSPSHNYPTTGGSTGDVSAGTPNEITGACPRDSIKVRVQPSGGAKSYETCSSITDSRNQCYYSRIGGPSVSNGARCLSGKSPMFNSLNN